MIYIYIYLLVRVIIGKYLYHGISSGMIVHSIGDDHIHAVGNP